MRQKKLKQLRKLAEYDNKVKPKYYTQTHGKRTKFVNTAITSPLNGRKITVRVPVEYRAYTVLNETKQKYNIAKKTFRNLSKTYNQKD